MSGKRKMTLTDKCEFEGCLDEAEYPLYEFREDYTKVWRHYCPKHDKEIADRNYQLRQEYPMKTWREVK